jgi:hypothetical protein
VNGRQAVNGPALRYEAQREQMEMVRRLLRANIGRRVRLTIDPRMTTDQDVTHATGKLMAASSVTDMVALHQTDEEHVDTLRRRERFEDGWLVSFELAHLLDVEREGA